MNINNIQKRALMDFREFLFKKEKGLSVSECLAEGIDEVLYWMDKYEIITFGEKLTTDRSKIK